MDLRASAILDHWMDLLGSQERVPGSLASPVRVGSRHLQGVSARVLRHVVHVLTVCARSDLNHRKLTYDCHAPASTPFDVAIGPLGSEPGAPPVLSLRTIKSDVCVGIEQETADRLDQEGQCFTRSCRSKNSGAVETLTRLFSPTFSRAWLADFGKIRRH